MRSLMTVMMLLAGASILSACTHVASGSGSYQKLSAYDQVCRSGQRSKASTCVSRHRERQPPTLVISGIGY